MTYSKKELFGGTITSDCPDGWKDLSDIRPVPDNQECFLDSLDSDDPQMLAVEILEMVNVEDDDAAAFFFKDLAEQNDAKQNKDDIRFVALKDTASPKALLEDDSIVAGTNEVRVCAGFGYQQVAMGRDKDVRGNDRRAKQEIKCIRVDLVVIRLPMQETDLLITVTNPADVDNLMELSLEGSSAQRAILDRVVSTFRIQNWGLFG